MESLNRISYEPEADVLMWEVADKPIDYAKEVGNIVVHFSKHNTPVLIEILEATKFLTKAQNLLSRSGVSQKRLSPAMQ